MVDIVAATLRSQLGVEDTGAPGTPVAANRQMLSFGFPRWSPMGEGQILTPQGYKVPTTQVPVGRRWVEGSYEGVLDFNEAEYILNSLVNSTTPTTEAINVKHWVHTVQAAAVETHQTYTWEQGNNQHAQRAPYMFFNSGRFEMDPLSQKISGNVMAQMFTDDVALTASPTILTPQVVPPQSFDVRIGATRAALLGTPQVETATAAGTATAGGNITVTVTAAGMTGSPKAVVVPILNGDTATVWAGKVRTALAADIDISGFFNVGGATTAIVLTRRAAAANDATMNLAIADTDTTGITPVVTSTDTTPGVAGASVYARPFSVALDIPNVQDVLHRMNSADSSFINTLEIPILPVMTFRTDADDAGMAYLTNWTAGSQTFISVTATGGAITGSSGTYAIRFMGACRINKGYSPTDDRGNAQAEWELALVLDPTTSMLFAIDVWNTLAAL
jgi:hypothetical protein